MEDRQPTRTTFGDISNIIGQGMLVDIVHRQFLWFFSETVTHIIHHSRRDNTRKWWREKKREERNRKQREYRARKRAEESNKQREERNRKQREYRARKKTPSVLKTPDHGIHNLIMYTILCLCIEMSNTVNFYTRITIWCRTYIRLHRC